MRLQEQVLTCHKSSEPLTALVQQLSPRLVPAQTATCARWPLYHNRSLAFFQDSSRSTCHLYLPLLASSCRHPWRQCLTMRPCHLCIHHQTLGVCHQGSRRLLIGHHLCPLTAPPPCQCLLVEYPTVMGIVPCHSAMCVEYHSSPTQQLSSLLILA